MMFLLCLKKGVSEKLNVFVTLVFLITGCLSKNVDVGKAGLENNNPLYLLMEGNERFRKNHPIHPDQTLERIRELKNGQHPFAVVISCSDSRVPPRTHF